MSGVLDHPRLTALIVVGVPFLAWVFDVEGKLRATGWLR